MEGGGALIEVHYFLRVFPFNSSATLRVDCTKNASQMQMMMISHVTTMITIKLAFHSYHFHKGHIPFLCTYSNSYVSEPENQRSFFEVFNVCFSSIWVLMVLILRIKCGHFAKLMSDFK